MITLVHSSVMIPYSTIRSTQERVSRCGTARPTWHPLPRTADKQRRRERIAGTGDDVPGRGNEVPRRDYIPTIEEPPGSVPGTATHRKTPDSEEPPARSHQPRARWVKANSIACYKLGAARRGRQVHASARARSAACRTTTEAWRHKATNAVRASPEPIRPSAVAMSAAR